MNFRFAAAAALVAISTTNVEAVALEDNRNRNTVNDWIAWYDASIKSTSSMDIQDFEEQVTQLDNMDYKCVSLIIEMTEAK